MKMAVSFSNSPAWHPAISGLYEARPPQTHALRPTRTASDQHARRRSPAFDTAPGSTYLNRSPPSGLPAWTPSYASAFRREAAPFRSSQTSA